MESKKVRCILCLFMKKTQREREAKGECRKNPPFRDNCGEAAWPVVKFDDYCHGFLSKNWREEERQAREDSSPTSKGG